MVHYSICTVFCRPAQLCVNRTCSSLQHTQGTKPAAAQCLLLHAEQQACLQGLHFPAAPSWRSQAPWGAEPDALPVLRLPPGLAAPREEDLAGEMQVNGHGIPARQPSLDLPSSELEEARCGFASAWTQHLSQAGPLGPALK